MRVAFAQDIKRVGAELLFPDNPCHFASMDFKKGLSGHFGTQIPEPPELMDNK